MNTAVWIWGWIFASRPEMGLLLLTKLSGIISGPFGTGVSTFTVPDWYIKDSLHIKVSVSENVTYRDTGKKMTVQDVSKFVQERLNVDSKTIKVGLNWLSFEYIFHGFINPIQLIKDQFNGIEILKQELVYSSPSGPTNFDAEDEIESAVQTSTDWDPQSMLYTAI